MTTTLASDQITQEVFDYSLVAGHARLIIDTRNAMARRGLISDRLVKA